MLFARLGNGASLQWACPHCNTINSNYLNASKPYLQCSHCKYLWYYGLIMFKAPGGPRIFPRDTLLIADSFPNRRQVNRVFCDACGTEISDKAIQQNIESSYVKIDTEEKSLREEEPHSAPAEGSR